eukprot:scaffold12829_cov116-Isochrysis_galbana.AAC.13
MRILTLPVTLLTSVINVVGVGKGAVAMAHTLATVRGARHRNPGARNIVEQIGPCFPLSERAPR